MSRHYIAIALLLLAVAGAYGNSLWGDFTFDDDGWVVRNPRVTTPSDESSPDTYHITEGSQLRLRWLSIWTYRANYVLHGFRFLPGWHIVNILIHFGCALLLYLILARAEGLKIAPRGTALIASIVFAVWPIGTEAVNYISARQTMLATFFTFASVYLTILAIDAPTPAARSGCTLGVLLAYAGAFLSKEVGLVFPLLFIIATVLAFSKEVRWFIGRHRTAFFLSLGGLIALAVAGVTLAESFEPDLWKQVKKKYTIIDDDVAVQPFPPAKVFKSYQLSRLREFPRIISLLLAPLPDRLSIDHHTPWEAKFDFRVLAGILLLAALLTGIVFAYLRAPTVGFGLACFFIALLPYWAIPSIIIVEYKLHLPLAGVAVCFGFTIAELRNALPGKRKLLIIPPIILLVIWGVLMSAVRNADWRDPVALWAKAESLAPDKARPPLMKGTHIYIKAHRETDKAKKGWLFEEAAQAFKLAAYNYKRNLLHTGSIYTLAYSNLAMLEYRRGRLMEAMKALEKGVGVRPENDHLIRGSVAMAEGRYVEAERQFVKSLGADPTYYETLKKYTALLVKLSRFSEAATIASDAVRYYPGNPECRLLIAEVRLQQKDYSQARSHIQAALRIDPGYSPSHFALGVVALEEKKPEETIEHLDRTIALGLNSWDIHLLRGQAFMQMERLNEAQEALQESITRAPNVRQPRLKLAEVFQKKKDYSAALEQYLEIRKIGLETIEVSNAIAGMLYKLKRYEEAIKEYLAAEKKAPKSCDIQLGLALTYHQLDKKVDACTAARKAIALGIKPEKLPEYLRQLLQETQPRKP